MSVVKVTVTNWDGNESVDGVEYRISYLVTTNSRDDGPAVVKAALPVMLDDAYSSGNDFDIAAILNSVSVTQVDPGNFFDWNVDTIYKSTERRTDPLLEPIQESVSWNGVEVETMRFYDGTPILNTAGIPLDTPVQKIDNRPTITYSLNQEVFPFSLAALVRNTVNSTTWKGFAPRTVKIQSMTTERIFDGKFGVYYRVTYTFEVNPDTYDLNVDSMSLYQLVDEQAVPAINATMTTREVLAKLARRELKAILVGDIPISVPVGLDAFGSVTNGLPPNPPIATVTGELYQAVDYNTLFAFLE